MSLGVSIIVPIYNVEPYLEKCLDSIINQTFKNIEIILINDGSKDNSLKICEHYARIDKRIRCLTQENKGVSFTRNRGIDEAKGKYFVFIDPDDWIELSMIEKLFNMAESYQLDMVMCEYNNIKNGIPKEVSLNVSSNILKQEEISQQIILEMISGKDLDSNMTTILGSACRVIFKKQFIKGNKLYFDNMIHLMEDLCFMLTSLTKLDRLGIIKEPLYNYLIRNDSATSLYRDDMYYLQLEVYKQIENLLLNLLNCSNIKERMDYRYIYVHLIAIINEMNNPNSTNKDKRVVIKKICSDEKFIFLMKKLDFKRYTFRKRFLLQSIKKKNILAIFWYYKFFGIVGKVLKYIKIGN